MWRIGNISHFSVPQLKPVKSEKAVPRVSVCLSPLCSCRTVGDWQRNAPSPCRQHGCPKRSWPPFSAATTARAVSGPVEIMQTLNRKSCITLSWERGENLCVCVYVCESVGGQKVECQSQCQGLIHQPSSAGKGLAISDIGTPPKIFKEPLGLYPHSPLFWHTYTL